MFSLSYREVNSLASLSVIATGPASDAVILSCIHVKVEAGHVTAHATDRHTAARIEFDLAHDVEAATANAEFVVDAVTLKKIAAAGKDAMTRKRGPEFGLVTVTPSEGRVDFVIDERDSFRVFPPRELGADRDATYPAVWRLFPSEHGHVHEIPAGIPINVDKLVTLSKLRHPDDVLTGRSKSSTGNFRVSLARKADDMARLPAPWYLTRRDGNVAVLVQPIAAAHAERGSL